MALCTNGCCREKSHAEDLADRATAYVRANYADPMFSLESMSDELGLNHQYVSRFFKEHVGVSFSRYLQETRMAAVEEAMRTSDAPLDTIAAAAGYQSPNSFYKAFRRHYGTTPGRFRREMSDARPASAGSQR